MSEVIKVTNAAKGIKGQRVGGPSKNELGDYYTCAECGQSVFMGDLGEVLHHEEPGHKPLTRQA